MFENISDIGIDSRIQNLKEPATPKR
jgi:hypothetical protein